MLYLYLVKDSDDDMIMDITIYCSDPGLGFILLVLKRFFVMIEVIAPIVLIVSLFILFTKVVTDPDNKKLQKNIQNAIFACVTIFLLPVLLNLTMNILGNNYTLSECWNNAYVSSSKSKYISKKSEEKKKPTSVYIDPKSYHGEAPINKSGTFNGQVIEGNAQSYKDVVWDPNDVTKISHLTSAQLTAVLNAYGGNATNFAPYATGFVTAENKYQINVFFLVALNALESGWYTSPISRGCNNLGGVCETSAHPSNGCGSNYNCAFGYYNSVPEYIDYQGGMLRTSYLTPGGSYYEGVSLSQVYTIHYCPGCVEAAGEIQTIANGLFSKVSSVM